MLRRPPYKASAGRFLFGDIEVPKTGIFGELLEVLSQYRYGLVESPNPGFWGENV